MSTSSALPSPVLPNAPRHRAPIACTHCRRRKVKCISSKDLTSTQCARCARRGLRCEYIAVSEQPAGAHDPHGPPLRLHAPAASDSETWGVKSSYVAPTSLSVPPYHHYSLAQTPCPQTQPTCPPRDEAQAQLWASCFPTTTRMTWAPSSAESSARHESMHMNVYAPDPQQPLHWYALKHWPQLPARSDIPCTGTVFPPDPRRYY
ncbi:hypothetical protein GGX14DRAFT_460952 [Mycena pura]|uniref:Zn(2)-C6 fungal-type domain-containing protein n=1 Tax=Mycena pura TaxID=153505 RepID=A0AAD6V913_9AGAR|nr:hypothetical protein GGX14DRAFT_460952 [Mycena pura]